MRRVLDREGEVCEGHWMERPAQEAVPSHLSARRVAPSCSAGRNMAKATSRGKAVAYATATAMNRDMRKLRGGVDDERQLQRLTLMVKLDRE